MAFQAPPAPKLPVLRATWVPRRTDLPVGPFGPFGSRNNPAGFSAFKGSGGPAFWGATEDSDDSTSYYMQMAAGAWAQYEAASDPELAAAKLKVQLTNWKALVQTYPALAPALNPYIAKAEAKLGVYEGKIARNEEAYDEARWLAGLSKVAIGAGILTLVAGAALLGTKTYKTARRSNGRKRRKNASPDWHIVDPRTGRRRLMTPREARHYAQQLRALAKEYRGAARAGFLASASKHEAYANKRARRRHNSGSW